MPNAPSEPLLKQELFFHFLRQSWPRTPDPAMAFPNLILVQNEPPLVALSMPNAPSGSLKNKDNFLPFFSRILAPNTWCRHGFSPSNSDPKPASHGRTFGAKRCFWILREFSVHFSCASGPRTPDPATAFPNLILVKNEPRLVALSVPNAPFESLEKKLFSHFFSVLPFFSRIQFVSICLAHLGPEHLTPPRLFPI